MYLIPASFSTTCMTNYIKYKVHGTLQDSHKAAGNLHNRTVSVSTKTASMKGVLDIGRKRCIEDSATSRSQLLVEKVLFRPIQVVGVCLRFLVVMLWANM